MEDHCHLNDIVPYLIDTLLAAVYHPSQCLEVDVSQTPTSANILTQKKEQKSLLLKFKYL